MKHRRAIDLRIPEKEAILYLGPLPKPIDTTFEDLPEWHALGGHCPKCEHEGWLLRYELQKAWGSRAYIGPLAQFLRCMRCGNREGNRWILGQLPR